MSNWLQKKITQELEQSLRDVHLKKNFEIIFVICIYKLFPQVFFKKLFPKIELPRQQFCKIHRKTPVLEFLFNQIKGLGQQLY